MGLKPTIREQQASSYRLESFQPVHAHLVASWIRDDREAFWLAPKTRPPITANDVRSWNRPGHEALQLVDNRGGAPLAYGELNILNAERGNFWLGHLIVNPDRRGHGLGQELTRRMLWRARAYYGARQVCLVVFPENTAAIGCYRAAGFRDDGFEVHDLRAYEVRVQLLRMAIHPLT